MTLKDPYEAFSDIVITDTFRVIFKCPLEPPMFDVVEPKADPNLFYDLAEPNEIIYELD